MIKAIETYYNGYRFRSRLEARWAVLMDALYVPYDYEPQGYTLSDGTPYLPDFWLSTSHTWLEIKPTAPLPEERDKIGLLASGTDSIGMLAWGVPELNCWHFSVYLPPSAKPTRIPYIINGTFEFTDSTLVKNLTRILGGSSRLRIVDRTLRHVWLSSPLAPNTTHKRLALAVALARGSRFEHGEHGGAA